MRSNLLKSTLWCLTAFCFCTNTTYAKEVGFESPEHILIGNEVVLPLSTQLNLPNGLVLTYGEMVALSGDYYGIPELPIALGATPQERLNRFAKAYNSLASLDLSKEEAKKILADIYLEESEIKAGVDKGESPQQVYERVNMDHIITANCITGGFCVADHPGLPKDVIDKIFVLHPGRLLKLAQTDFDHFAEYAWSSYSAGHTIALSVASKAHATNDVALLNQAYAINGFASHFLSDLFSAGHMRTPHYLLRQKVFPAEIGSLLANRMHNEDGLQGLTISNAAGDHWIAYGDTMLLEERNKQNHDILHKAMQASVDEIYATFQTGVLPVTDTVAKFIPKLSELNDNVGHINSAPLFFWDAKNNQLSRRSHVKDKWDYERTSVWFGWSTLLELSTIKKLSVSEQEQLLKHNETRDMALQLGLIKDKELIDYQQLSQ